jgi:hypothetical protein
MWKNEPVCGGARRKGFDTYNSFALLYAPVVFFYWRYECFFCFLQ